MSIQTTRFPVFNGSAIIASLVTCIFFMLTVTSNIEQKIDVGNALNFGFFLVVMGGALYGLNYRKLELKRSLGFSLPLCVLLILVRLDGSFLPDFNPRIAYSAIVVATLSYMLGLKGGALMKQFFNN